MVIRFRWCRYRQEPGREQDCWESHDRLRLPLHLLLRQ